MSYRPEARTRRPFPAFAERLTLNLPAVARVGASQKPIHDLPWGIVMFAVMSVISIAMAFVAIWFTSEALKRLDFNHEALLRPYLRKINAALDEHREASRAMQARLEALEKQVRILKLHAEMPQAAAHEVAAAQPVIGELQRFTPSVRLNG
jgi:hypothetical protein